MTLNEANVLFRECSKNGSLETIQVSRTIHAVKIVLENKHDITFFFYNGIIAKIEEYDGRCIIEKWVDKIRM